MNLGLDGWHGPHTRHFLRHFGEMMAAMILGMCVLGMAFRAIHIALFGAGFATAWRSHTELAVFAMTFNMAFPMVLWMRHRGHSWERNVEMSGAMIVVAVIALVPFWLGFIPGGATLGLDMLLMVPGMLLAMLYRVDEYSGPRRVPAKSPGAHGHAITH
jgi:hypothetical protein